MESKKDELHGIMEMLKDTRMYGVLCEMKELYGRIESEQSEWYEKSGVTCPQGCGECCRNFEPDLLDCEAIYMAAWLIENMDETAQNVAEGIFPYPQNKGCPFWNENAEYHCTIYGARPFICRLFGACGSAAKDGSIAFKPCKFYPAEKLSKLTPPLAHRQYAQKEVLEIFGTLPPLMSKFMEKAIAINPQNNSTALLREILPETVRRLKWLCNMAAQHEPPRKPPREPPRNSPLAS